MSIAVATELEQRIAASVNAARADAGLPALKIETHLNASAQAHSDWMGETGTFSHTGEGGSTSGERIEDAGFPLTGDWHTAENIAARTLVGDLDAGEADALHARLMESPGHHKNIMDPEVAYLGVGLSVGVSAFDDIDRESVYLTEHFADTEGQVLVQEEVDGQTVLQPYQNGEPVGDPQPAEDPEDPEDQDDPPPDEEDEEEPEAASAGGCFVATAAYGSWSHPDVAALRRFRDEVLVRHRAGRAFIRAYRAVGPKLARLVTPAGLSGRAARALISPLARLARKWNSTGSS